MLASLRWPLLIAALAMAVLYWAPMAPTWIASAELNNLLSNITAAAAPLLQGLGVLGMRAQHRARAVKAPWSTLAAIAAAALWVVALLAGLAGQAAGPGGLVYGLLVMLPAAIAAPLLQIASLLGFARAERKVGLGL